VAIACFSLFAASLVTSTMAWFTTTRTATVTFTALNVKGDNFSSFSADFYRYDGLRYSYPSNTVTNNSGTSVNQTFSMLEYDTIIKEKNLKNNLISKITFQLSSGVTATSAVITVNSFNDTIYTGDSSAATTSYHLSDLLGVDCLAVPNPSVSATDNETICSELTSAFNSSSGDSGYKGSITSQTFVSVDDKTSDSPTATGKVTALTFTVDISSLDLTNSVTIYLNFDYLDYLVKAVVAGYGQFVNGESGTYEALNDISMSLEVR
jgi:hypothetical protein